MGLKIVFVGCCSRTRCTEFLVRRGREDSSLLKKGDKEKGEKEKEAEKAEEEKTTGPKG